MRKRIFLACLLVFSLQADEAPLEDEIDFPAVEAPWFTGPLITPSSGVIPLGHFNFEPYLFAVANTAIYNGDWKPVKMETLWNTYFQPLLQIGLTPWMDIQLVPTLYYNFTHGAANWAFGDFQAELDFQLYQSSGKPTDWGTSLKLALIETIPSGKYQNLDPNKLFTQVGGAGSWKSALGLVWGNLFYLGKCHFLSTRTSVQYTYSVPLHVKNFNVYGGSYGTRGKVYPGQNLQIAHGMELSLTKNWVLALDILAGWSARSRFVGQTLVKNTLNSSFQCSLAPAIEYNWNSHLGIILGPWFTVAGRNSPKFTSAAFALNYYY